VDLAAASTTIQAMVGFRNVAAPDYRKINLEVVKSILEVF
jgi:uncharacterized protein YutE (UPF0331/DUF86 family)